MLPTAHNWLFTPSLGYRHCARRYAMQSLHRSRDRSGLRSHHPVVALGYLLLSISTLTVMAGAALVMARSPSLLLFSPGRTNVSTVSTVDSLARGPRNLNTASLFDWIAASIRLVDDTAEITRYPAVTLAQTGALRLATREDLPPEHEVNVHILGYGAVNLSPRGPYAADEVVAALADPAPGYRFDHWSGALTGIENPITFTISSDIAMTATFVADDEPRSYVITTAVVGGGAIEVTPPGPYSYGETVHLTARAEDGWRFSRWSGEIGGWQNPYAYSVIEDTTVVALFELESTPPTITLSVGQDGQGEVTVDPVGPYVTGQTITLTASPAPGWEFGGWNGHLSGTDNPYIMTITTHTTAIARFQVISPPVAPVLNLRVEGEGEVQAEPGEPYTLGQLVKVTANAQPGWRFDHWSGDFDGDANPHAFAILGETTLTAHFTPLRTTPVSLAIHIAGAGQVRRDPPGPYSPGQVVTITAEPESGWRFTGWSGDQAGTQNPYSFSIDRDLVITSTFMLEESLDDPPGDGPPGDPAPDPVDAPIVEVQVAGAGLVERVPPGPYEPGQAITLTAQAESGWAFASWSGALQGQQNPQAVTLTTTLAVTATFVPVANTYLIAVKTAGAGEVALAPPGPYLHSQQVTLTATPERGQCFQSWQGDLAGVTNPLHVQMASDLAVTAQFGPCPVHLPMVVSVRH